MESFICTASGHRFDPFAPRSDAIHAADIAHALSSTPRFGGHCRQFYSVAQHSLIVCELVEEEVGPDTEVMLAALLHDASEAYVLDMPSPIKRRLPDYRALERGVQAAIEARFDVSEAALTHRPTIKAADIRALHWEQRDLMPRVPWVPLPEFDRPQLVAWPSELARDRFLSRFEALFAARRLTEDRGAA